MALQFSLQITPDEIREATAGIFWRQVTQPKLLSTLLVLLAMLHALLWAVLPQAPLLLHAMFAVLFIVSALALGAFASRYYQAQALQNFQRFQGAPVAVSLDEEAYRYQATWGEGAIPWASLDSLWRFPGVWVLLQHRSGGISVLLPSAGLDPEARAFIERKLDEVQAEVRG